MKVKVFLARKIANNGNIFLWIAENTFDQLSKGKIDFSLHPLNRSFQIQRIIK